MYKFLFFSMSKNVIKIQPLNYYATNRLNFKDIKNICVSHICNYCGVYLCDNEVALPGEFHEYLGSSRRSRRGNHITAAWNPFHLQSILSTPEYCVPLGGFYSKELLR